MIDLKASFRRRLTDRQYAAWACRMLLSLQELDEQQSKRSRWRNGVGFASNDASVLTSIGEKLESGEDLTDAEWDTLTSRLQKYSRQFAVPMEPSREG